MQQKDIILGHLNSWVVSHLALIISTLCHALGREFKTQWWQTLFGHKHNIYAFFMILFGLFDLILLFVCQICHVNCEKIENKQNLFFKETYYKHRLVLKRTLILCSNKDWIIWKELHLVHSLAHRDCCDTQHRVSRSFLPVTVVNCFQIKYLFCHSYNWSEMQFFVLASLSLLVKVSLFLLFPFNFCSLFSLKFICILFRSFFRFFSLFLFSHLFDSFKHFISYVKSLYITEDRNVKKAVAPSFSFICPIVPFYILLKSSRIKLLLKEEFSITEFRSTVTGCCTAVRDHSF